MVALYCRAMVCFGLLFCLVTGIMMKGGFVVSKRHKHGELVIFIKSNSFNCARFVNILVINGWIKTPFMSLFDRMTFHTCSLEVTRLCPSFPLFLSHDAVFCCNPSHFTRCIVAGESSSFSVKLFFPHLFACPPIHLFL